MERSSDMGETDLLLSIQRQIGDFTYDQLEQSLDLQHPEFNSGGMGTLTKHLEKELEELTKDVEELHSAQAVASMDKTQQLKALNEPESKLPVSDADSTEAELEAEISQLDKELELLESVTGLAISKTSSKITDIGSTFLVKHYKLEGSCHSMPFQMRFDVEERWNPVSDLQSEAKVTNTKVKLSDEDKNVVMPILEGLASYDSLTLMLNALVGYAKWKSDTKDFVNELCEKYPIVAEGKVDKEYNMLLIVCPPQHPGCEWTFTFNLEVSSDFTMTPSASVIVKVPKEHLDDNSERLYLTVPSKFQLMQSVLGVQAATKTLIQTLLQRSTNFSS